MNKFTLLIYMLIWLINIFGKILHYINYDNGEIFLSINQLKIFPIIYYYYNDITTIIINGGLLKMVYELVLNTAVRYTSTLISPHSMFISHQ